MFGSMIDFRILCGIVGGGITYIIQVYVMALYSIAYPKFVP
jgi:hypothetical protein